MSEDRPLFILAGNAPYVNRGCEAITRGTVKILRNSFKNPKFICISHFQSEQQYQKQKIKETDDAITHLSYRYLNKKMLISNFWKPVIWEGVYQHITDRDSIYSWGYHEMLPYLKDASAILSVGGDNYTLDYGVPRLFTGLDDLVIARKKPIVLWGASIGPFSTMPDYERYMSSHLKKVTGIFARESATVQYLKDIGVADNVYPVGDPAFLMDPIKPTGIDDEMPIEKNAIGINLSP
ncbi:MAG TPA: polysaccharide pyruvyl transferase family protein, partial [Methanocella sp.]|nr:polysaccharide pyruvyl transferase family protein [Methanocella sp.]